MATSLSCTSCTKDITSEYVKLEGERNYHPDCFACSSCKKSLGGLQYFENENELYCEDDYHKKFSPSCGGCHQTIKDEYVEVLGLNYHKGCFVCHDCKKPFAELQFYKYNGESYCDGCYKKKASQCHTCGKPIIDKTYSALNKTYHLDCFVCTVCSKPFEGGSFVPHQDRPYHQDCYKAKFAKICGVCQKEINGEYYCIQGTNIHKDCYEKFKTLSAEEQQKLTAQAQTKTTTEEKKEEKPTASVDVKVAEPILQTTVVAAHKLEEGLKNTEPESSPIGTVYSYELLTSHPFPKGVDPTRREQYLTHSEFQRLFGMKHEEFQALPKWKQNEAKKKFKLF